MVLRLCACIALLCSLAGTAATLDTVVKRGSLLCGVVREDAEYSTDDDHGSRGTLDDDLCKAFAVAVLGESASLRTVGFLDDVSAMNALRSGTVDVIATISSDFTHATANGITLSHPIFYDQVGILVPVAAHIAHAQDLANKKVCVIAETEVEIAARAWFAKEHVPVIPYPFQEEGEMEAAYATNNCAAIAADLTRLATIRSSFGSIATQYAYLPETLADDTMSAATRDDDPRWSKTVNAVLQILVAAEEQAVTSTSAPEPNPSISKLLGTSRNIGHPLGLRETWAADVIRIVGNYGDIYDRAFNTAEGGHLPRGANRLIRDGGKLHAMPLK